MSSLNAPRKTRHLSDLTIFFCYLPLAHLFEVEIAPKLLFACRRKKAIVMEYVNQTVSQHFEALNSHFSLKTILMLAINMVTLMS